MVAENLKFNPNNGVSAKPQCFVCGQKAREHIVQAGTAHVFGAAIPLVTTENQKANVAVVICMNCMTMLRASIMSFMSAVVAAQGQAPVNPPAQPEQNLKFPTQEKSDGNS